MAEKNNFFFITNVLVETIQANFVPTIKQLVLSDLNRT